MLSDVERVMLRRADEQMLSVSMAPPTTKGRPKGPTIDAERMRRLHADGLTDTEIAEVMGFHRSSVQAARTKLGLAPNRTNSPAPREEIRRLHGAGHSDSEISRRLGLHRSRVCELRLEMGLPTNYRRTA